MLFILAPFLDGIIVRIVRWRESDFAGSVAARERRLYSTPHGLRPTFFFEMIRL
jgi:hypothetical protein